MDRRGFLKTAGAGGALLQTRSASGQLQPGGQLVHPGIWKFTFGRPEKITPVSTRRYAPEAGALAALTAVEKCPVTVSASSSRRGQLVRVPLAGNEIVYGLGLQLQSVVQRGLKKRLRVNADPKMDTGDSHAPVPFYVTTGGYGILIDTARYATFYCGSKVRKGAREGAAESAGAAVAQDALPAAYRRYRFHEPSEVLVEIPEAEGIDVYVFAGPQMREAVQRYVLFSGGGALPPRWGLGMWYRVKGDYGEADALQLASEFRDRRIPCDVIGLEPGWQTHAYSCTYVWSKKFPDPARFLREMTAKSYRVNLWEHAFTHPDSPIYKPLLGQSGDFEVWGGVVPDFLSAPARRTFADYHEKEHVALGVSGYKLDECDNSDFTGNWSWPELAAFPSGADGEQMHSLFGLRYQDAILGIFEKRGQRTYGLVRSSGALAAPYPFVLYSDLYDHKEFIRGVVNMGFSGLLWTPELRNAASAEDLIRRLQSVVLSPLALINGWYIKNPPWKQVDRNKNNADQLTPDWEQIEAQCRNVMQLRMRLVPYLHAAFVKYRRTGLPPFRALVMDHPGDPATWALEDQYLVGDALLAAPVVAGQHTREVYLPEGEWHDFWSGKRYAGKQRITVDVPLDQIPLFVKSGTILPLAEPTGHTGEGASLRLTVHVYGSHPAPASLFEDDDSGSPALNEVTLSWNGEGELRRSGSARAPRYEVASWHVVS
jgi:alpha-D-xyloside xylohydrolase